MSPRTRRGFYVHLGNIDARVQRISLFTKDKIDTTRVSTKVYLTSLLLASASPAILPELTSAAYINENPRIDVTVHSSGLRMAQLEERWVRNSDLTQWNL
jgi:hypothetical protein